MSGLGDDLTKLIEPVSAAQSVPKPSRPSAHPVGRDWQPGVQYASSGDMLVTTPAGEKLENREDWTEAVRRMGLSVPEGWTVRLVEARYNETAWTREEQGEDAVTKPSWCYKFKIEPGTLSGYGPEDVALMVRDVMRRRRPAREIPETTDRALVIVYADAQTGKVDSRGGTAELLERIAEKFDRLDDHIRDLRKVGRGPDAAFWLDAGDCIEGQQNVASQIATNDLTMTQMVRAHRRITFDGLDRLARTFNRVVAATCGSNHAQHRINGKVVGPPSDDWGIEIMSQVADAYSRNEDAYGHVSFVLPEEWQESVSLDIAGTIVGLSHGHQFRPGKGVDWWKGQSFGGQPVAGAQVLVTGHYHHFKIETAGNGRLWIQAPTLDNGSSWFTQTKGEDSPAGLLVFSVTSDGVDDLRIL